MLERCVELLDSPDLVACISSVFERVLRGNGQGLVAQQQIGLAVRFLFSCLIDADRIDTADFEHRRTKKFRPCGSYVPWSVLIDRLERHLSAIPLNHSIDGLRREISQHCLEAASRERGVYTLTVPTGGGKTLASLRFALHHAERRRLDRIIYVIPFTSIIDRERIESRSGHPIKPKDAHEDQGKVVLEHHASITPEQQTWREKVLCENWDAPVVYTTMVQFLESLFGANLRITRCGGAVCAFWGFLAKMQIK